MSRIVSAPATPPVATFVWRGQRGEPRHAYLKLPHRRLLPIAPAACGYPWFDERWEWPTGAKCGVCLARVAAQTGQGFGL